MTPVRYRVCPRDPNAHRFEVDCTLDDPAPDGQRFAMAAWIPGSYLIREFARNVVAIRARAGGREVAVTKEAKDRWRVAPCAGPLTVTIDVYALDLSVRAAWLDAQRGYFNGTSLFLLPEGHAHAPCVVDIEPPPAPAGRGWKVATTLPRDGAPAWGFGRYGAANHDELVDHPVEMADFAQVAFEAGGATHDVVVTGRAPFDGERLAADLARVCQWQCDLFGGAPGSRAPVDRYLFQVLALGDGYGGLEHRASTSLVCSRRDLPLPGATAISDGYRSFLGLASHEYFHTWNVKRIKPSAFTPYDLAREATTRLLWAFEGITSYYDDLALVKSGVIDLPSYLELLGRTISAVERTPGRRVQSVGDASFDAWIKYYRPDENSPNATVSYYAKGALVALALDLALRATGRATLDDLMRALWKRHGEPGIGVPEDGLRRLAAELAGRDFGEFFDRYVDGTDELPLAALLAGAGLALRFRPASGAKDRGGKAATEVARASIGAVVGADLKLRHVFNGGAAERAGLAGGDALVALDGLRASAERLDELAREAAPGTRVPVHAFRRDELVEAVLELDAAPADTAWIEVDPQATPDATARREAWLGR